MRVPFCMESLISRKESKHFHIARFVSKWTLQTGAQNLKYWLARNAIETNKILRNQWSHGSNFYGILNVTAGLSTFLLQQSEAVAIAADLQNLEKYYTPNAYQIVSLSYWQRGRFGPDVWYPTLGLSCATSTHEFVSRPEPNRTEPNYTKRWSFGVVYFQFGWFQFARPASEILIFQLEKHTFSNPRYETITILQGAVAIFKTLISLCL